MFIIVLINRAWNSSHNLTKIAEKHIRSLKSVSLLNYNIHLVNLCFLWCIYRYPNEMDGEGSRNQPGNHHGNQQYPPDVPIVIDSNMKTLYIPKSDGGKTLMRRRRASSKRRSSSRRRREHEDINDLMMEQDNHLLPSLRYTRRHRMKSLKGTCCLRQFGYRLIFKLD